MPDISRMFPKRFLDVQDLPQDGTVVPVTIQQIYCDGITPGRGQFGAASPEWRIKFAEYPKPVSMRPKRAKEIAALLGSENTDTWHGKRIGIYAGWYDAWGEQKWGILVSQQPVEQLPVISPQGQIAAGNTYVLPAKADSLGVDRAAQICVLLSERGKTWDDLRAHLTLGGFGEAIAGRLPPECPVSIRQAAWTYINGFAPVKEPPSAETFKQMWQPPPAKPLPVAGEVVNKQTGEVINLKAGQPGQAPVHVEQDDIPF